MHQEVLLDLVNMAWFGVVDSTKFSIMAYEEIDYAAGCKSEVEIAPSVSGIFLEFCSTSQSF